MNSDVLLVAETEDCEESSSKESSSESVKSPEAPDNNENSQGDVSEGLFVISSAGVRVYFSNISKCHLDDNNILCFKLNWLDNDLNDDNPTIYWQSFEQCPLAAAEVTIWTETSNKYCALVGIENFGTPTLDEMRDIINNNSTSTNK